MTPPSRSLPWQPFLAIATVSVAAASLCVAWAFTFVGNKDEVDERTALLLLCLFAAMILTYHFPVHVDPSSKIYMGSIVLYLMAALLPPAVAGTAIAVAILAGELSVRHRTGNHRLPTIIPTQVARWSLIGLAGSTVAHIPADAPILPLAAACVVMWSGDILTGPLLLSPVLNRHPVQVMRMMVHEGGLVEASQYLIGLIGVLVAKSYPWALLLLLPPAALVYVAFKRSTELSAETSHMLEEIADSVDARDYRRNGHSRRVADLTRDALRVLGTRGPEVDQIVAAARLHDIGKIAIPDELLLKAGKFTPAERAIMETHAEKGADILTRHPDLVAAARIVRHHHEAWDGSGYPHHLKGSEIPHGSRVIAVADSFDAMTSDRAHRRRMSLGHAAAMLRDGRGRQWDPEIVDAFLEVVSESYGESATPHLRLVHDRDAQDEIS